MAKVHGTILHRDGGFTSGRVGDLPVGEAVAVVTEGRLELEHERSTFATDVEMLLAGLGVGDMRELRMLVEAGRAARAEATW